MIEIVPLRLELCEAVYEIARKQIPEHWSLQGIQDVLKYDNNIYYVARTVPAKQVIGFGGIMIIADEAELLNIAVQEDYARRGIADLLMTQLLEDAKAHNAYRMLLEVRESNEVAQHLYKKHRFNELGKRKDYYSNPKEDALIMERML